MELWSCGPTFLAHPVYWLVDQNSIRLSVVRKDSVSTDAVYAANGHTYNC